MRKIPLSQGKFALVDDEDYEELNEYKWFAANIGTCWYAARNIKISPGIWRTTMMHRHILITDKFIDHINQNGLDNRKENLREATASQNLRNRGPHKNGLTSKYKGISRIRKTGMWRALITKDEETLHIGMFNNEKTAAKAYDEEARRLHGEFAYLNFPNERAKQRGTQLSLLKGEK